MKPQVQKKKQPSQALGTTKDIFVSFVSNNRVIEAATKRPWWIALIIALVALWLPVLPIISSYSRTSGASFVGTYGYGFQEELSVLTSALHYNEEDSKEYNIEEKPVDFKVNDKKTLDLYVDGTKTTRILEDAEQPQNFAPLARYVSKHDQGGTIVYQTEFEIYYAGNGDYTFKEKVGSLIDYLYTRKYEVGTKDTKWTDSSAVEAYTPSFMVLYEKGFCCYVYKDESTKLSGHTLAADWKHTKKDVFLIQERLLAVDGFTDEEINNQNWIDGVYKNWKGVFNESYKTQRSINVKFFMGLYLGVYAVLILMMGLLVFFMTRGKHNMFNYLKFIECMKISWWASLSPALLAMILSFILPGLASMLFIVLMGLRIMWLSMKQLRPQ